MKILMMGGLGLLLIAGGAFLYWLRSRDYAKALATLAWPKVPGRITASAVMTTKFQSSMNLDTEGYVPAVTYSYEVGGTAYEGSRISFADLVDPALVKPNAMVAKYPVGADVQVSYDPANPAESVLEASTKGTSPFSLNVICLFVAGVGAIIWGFLI